MEDGAPGPVDGYYQFRDMHGPHAPVGRIWHIHRVSASAAPRPRLIQINASSIDGP